jgi:hypothetical protein
MPSPERPASRLLLNPGAQAEPFLEFPEYEEEELNDLAKVPSATCVEEAECSSPPRPGESGTERSM